MIEKERVSELNDKPINYLKNNVIYWMQSSQRVDDNHALEYAINLANELKKNLIVYFGITENYPEANERHYYFMLEGLKSVKKDLKKRKIRMVVLKGSPEIEILKFDEIASVFVADAGYLKHEKMWRKYVSQQISCKFVKIETNVIVPVEVASEKEEYSAATIRRKLEKKVDEFSRLPETIKYEGEYETDIKNINEIQIDDIDSVIKMLKIDKNVKKVSNFVGGTKESKLLLEKFLENNFIDYSSKRNEPSGEYGSNMSPYLHFGQISPIYIYNRVIDFCKDNINCDESKKAYIEEVFVRRELSMNFVNYNENYDSYEGLPNWAKKTLELHLQDERPYIYDIDKLEFAKTHDVYWNCAQKELLLTGKMQGYMRMYWGKKVIEWTKNPREAYEILLYLNNKYELDGRDANGYTGVAWCFGKHDRPWGERTVFGNVRYMAYSGLKRKFDMESYVDRYDV